MMPSFSTKIVHAGAILNIYSGRGTLYTCIGDFEEAAQRVFKSRIKNIYSLKLQSNL